MPEHGNVRYILAVKNIKKEIPVQE